MSEKSKWISWLSEEINETHHFTVEYSLKKYALSGRDLLKDLAHESSGVFVYSSKIYDDNDILSEHGWEKSRGRYIFKKGVSDINPEIFYNLNHTFVFVFKDIGESLQKFLALCSEPFVVNNVSSGKTKNSWLYTRKIAQENLVLCKNNSVRPSFTIANKSSLLFSALNIVLEQNKT